ncbi:MAG: ribonuclease P protein component [Bacteroidales bacterium]|jgi:ribonuclease P protein component|nr:ribonuclease P protein component [Bacteroidales bacterium]
MNEGRLTNTGLLGKNRLTKNERLHLKSDIDSLFKTGKWFTQDEFAIVYRFTEGDIPAIFISIPKKHQHKAWQRVQSRRMIREAYRKNKHILINALDKSNVNIHFAIICKSRNALEYQPTKSKIILTLQRLTEIISK